MSLDVLVWLVVAAAALITEATGLLHLHGFRPLTWIIRGEMKQHPPVAGVVAMFIAWLAWHFLVATYLPGGLP